MPFLVSQSLGRKHARVTAMSFLGSYFASVGFALFEWRCGFGGCSWASVSCAVSYFGIIHQLIYNDKQRGSGGSRSHLVGGGWSGTQHGCLPTDAHAVDLFCFIQLPSFSTTVRLYLSMPPCDSEWRGFPCTTTRSGHICLSSVMTSPMN